MLLKVLKQQTLPVFIGRRRQTQKAKNKTSQKGEKATANSNSSANRPNSCRSLLAIRV